MSSATVRTKEELKRAQQEGVQEIIVEGELAEKLRSGKKAASLGAAGIAAIAAIGAGAAFTPFTFGISNVVGLTAAAAITGMEIAAITAAVFVGVALVIAVWKDYEEIEFSSSPLRLKLKRRR